MNIQTYHRKTSILISSVLFLFSTWGCSALFLVPVTLKEVKDYVSERKQSFSNPLDEVLVSTGYSLKALDFELKRIEYVGSRGLIHASAKEPTDRSEGFPRTGDFVANVDLSIFGYIPYITTPL